MNRLDLIFSGVFPEEKIEAFDTTASDIHRDITVRKNPDGPSIKVVIFSQWTSMLDLVDKSYLFNILFYFILFYILCNIRSKQH